MHSRTGRRNSECKTRSLARRREPGVLSRSHNRRVLYTLRRVSVQLAILLQVAHVRKIVRLLSLSDDQIAAMPEPERQQVSTIRSNAVYKMRLAHALHGGPSPHISGSACVNAIASQGLLRLLPSLMRGT